jgi:hypothetical protein
VPIYRIQHLQALNDFAGGKDLDLKFVVGGLCHPLCNLHARTEKRVEALGIARRHTPADLGRRLRKCRRCDARGRGKTCPFKYGSSIHGSFLTLKDAFTGCCE